MTNYFSRFLFIFGWLRVAETLYNPFGEDDEDFELNELLNRHFRVAMSIVDDYEDPPELKKDIFWNLTEPELIENPEIIDIQVRYSAIKHSGFHQIFMWLVVAHNLYTENIKKSKQNRNSFLN